MLFRSDAKDGIRDDRYLSNSKRETCMGDAIPLNQVASQKFAQTIVMITHNEEIAQMADRIIRIEDGRIVSEN